MKKIYIIFFCLVTLVTDLSSQTKYWVNFTDKNNNPYNLGNPGAFLSAQSVLRRTFYNVPYHPTDLPVTPSYISQVAAVPGVTVMYASKWINGVVIAVTNTNVLGTINSFSFVSSSTVVNKYKLGQPAPEAPVAPVTQQNRSALAAATPSSYYGGSYWQAKQLGLQCLHDQGYRGQGIIIAVLDAGFSNVDINPVFDSLRNRSGILGTRDFVAGGTSVYEDDSHGAMVLSCMAAIKPNVIVGTAPLSNYWLLRTEEAASEKIIEEYNWIRGAEFADSVGADILSTSLGYTTFDNPAQNHTFAELDGRTSKMSIAANLAARKGLFVLNSAGNGNGSPWPKISMPADADSICTVGAIDTLYNVTGFSSIGPTADGRIKPDLVARGGNAWVSYNTGSCGYANGTSFSCPILAGAVACFWQAHKTYTNIKILDTLRHTASFSLTPNNSRGWGTTNMCLIAPIIFQPTGIQENAKSIGFSLVPTPFSGSLQLSSPQVFSPNSKVKLSDMLGRQLISEDLPAGKNDYELNTSSLPAGVYTVEVWDGKNKSMKKTVKQ